MTTLRNDLNFCMLFVRQFFDSDFVTIDVDDLHRAVFLNERALRVYLFYLSIQQGFAGRGTTSDGAACGTYLNFIFIDSVHLAIHLFVQAEEVPRACFHKEREQHDEDHDSGEYHDVPGSVAFAFKCLPDAHYHHAQTTGSGNETRDGDNFESEKDDAHEDKGDKEEPRHIFVLLELPAARIEMCII
jgi:hypothetical protein